VSVALKRTSSGVSEMAVKRASYVAWSQYVFKLEVTSLCRYTCTQPCLSLVSGFVDDAMRNTVPRVNEPLLQLVSVAFRFLWQYLHGWLIGSRMWFVEWCHFSALNNPSCSYAVAERPVDILLPAVVSSFHGICSRHVNVIACPPPNIVCPCRSSSLRKTFSFYFTLI